MIRKLTHLVRVARAAVRERLKSRRRSPQWDEVRDRRVAIVGACEACGGKKRLQVHHVEPFHLAPERELDEENLIVLCMGDLDCHLLIGHGGAFAFYDPLVRDHAKAALLANDQDMRVVVEKMARKQRRRDESPKQLGKK